MILKYRIKQVDDRFFIQELVKIDAINFLCFTLTKQHEYWYTIKLPYQSLEQANNVIYNYLHSKQEVTIHEYKNEKL